MSKKKRRQGNKPLNVQSKATETVTTQEMIQVPEIKEIQERKEAAEEVRIQESVAEEKTKKKVITSVLFGSLVTAAILFLAICLYKTVGELRAVQTMSGSLQTDLKTAETKLDELLMREESFLAQLQKEKEEAGGASEDEEELLPEITKKPRTTPEPERYTVCIDAGHGAYDTGAVLESEDGTVRYEKDDNLRLAQLVKEELEAYGIKVLMTRDDDSFLELYDRTLLANSMDVEALISFHRNAYYVNGKMDDKVGGVEIWIHNSRPTEARQLANRILDAILDVGGLEDRGVRYGSMTDVEENYAINRRAVMTSMIIEMGFISNAEDNAAYDANAVAYAKAIAKEIYDWLVQ